MLYLAVVPVAPLMPPIGVDATVLSEIAVLVSWTESVSVSPTDESVYTVRYGQRTLRGRYRYVNVTKATATLDQLRPHTEYEISVRVSRGSRHSTWSMSVLVVTKQAGMSVVRPMY